MKPVTGYRPLNPKTLPNRPLKRARRKASPFACLGPPAAKRTRLTRRIDAMKPMAVRPALDVLRVPGWQQNWLIHGFSSRTGGHSSVYRPSGDLNLGFTAADKRETVIANRSLFVDALAEERNILGLVTLNQIHSSLIWKVDATDIGESPAHKGDGLMTGTPGVLIGIQTADCIPILLADRKHRAVAAFHAGWRGTLARIVEHGVGRMRLEFGSKPENLVASIGPGIGQCCYSIGGEVREQFESQFSYAADLFHEVFDRDPVKEKYPMLFLTARAPGHSDLGPGLHLDLAEANRRQLLAAGLKSAAIYSTGQCTGCHTDRFFSHRKEQGFTGRMLSVIGIAQSKAVKSA